MIEALVAGSTDPQTIADLAIGKLRSKLPQLKEALEGRFRSHHASMASEILAHIDYLEETIERLSTEVERLIAPFSKQVELLDTIPGVDKRTAEVILGRDRCRHGPLSK